MKTRSSSFKDKYETWNIISNGKQATPRIYSEKSAISDLKKIYQIRSLQFHFRE